MQQPEPAKSNGAASGAICVNSLGFLPGQQKKALYQFNEIAINWNAALIYALAGFVSNN